MERPRVLWLADERGWAYNAIVWWVSSYLSEYEHRVIYFSERDLESTRLLIKMAGATADIIVSMYLRYQEFVSPNDKHKVVMMLTGFRPFEIEPNRRKRIAWIIDTPGWAYDNRARGIAEHLRDYDYTILEYPRAGFLPLKNDPPDLVVCPDPRLIHLVRMVYSGPIVLNLNAPKLFKDWVWLAS